MVLNYIDIPSPRSKSCFFSEQMGDKGKTEGTVLKAKQRVFHFSATLCTLIKHEMNRGFIYYLRKQGKISTLRLREVGQGIR